MKKFKSDLLAIKFNLRLSKEKEKESEKGVVTPKPTAPQSTVSQPPKQYDECKLQLRLPTGTTTMQ